MIYTAGWEAGGKFMGEGDGGNKMPEPNHWYLNNTYSKSKTTNRRRRGEESREERRKGGEGRKEGTQIINATGLRPFRIFKRNKLLLSTRTFHFPFSFFIIVSTYLEKKKKSNSTSQMIYKFTRNTLSLKFSQTMPHWWWPRAMRPRRICYQLLLCNTNILLHEYNLFSLYQSSPRSTSLTLPLLVPNIFLL